MGKQRGVPSASEADPAGQLSDTLRFSASRTNVMGHRPGPPRSLRVRGSDGDLEGTPGRGSGGRGVTRSCDTPPGRQEYAPPPTAPGSGVPTCHTRTRTLSRTPRDVTHSVASSVGPSRSCRGPWTSDGRFQSSSPRPLTRLRPVSTYSTTPCVPILVLRNFPESKRC